MSSKKEDINKKGFEFALWMMGFVDNDGQWEKGEQLIMLTPDNKHAEVLYDPNRNQSGTRMQFFRTHQTCLEYLQAEIKEIPVLLTK